MIQSEVKTHTVPHKMKLMISNICWSDKIANVHVMRHSTNTQNRKSLKILRYSEKKQCDVKYQISFVDFRLFDLKSIFNEVLFFIIAVALKPEVICEIYSCKQFSREKNEPSRLWSHKHDSPLGKICESRKN